MFYYYNVSYIKLIFRSYSVHFDTIDMSSTNIGSDNGRNKTKENNIEEMEGYLGSNEYNGQDDNLKTIQIYPNRQLDHHKEHLRRRAESSTSSFFYREPEHFGYYHNNKAKYNSSQPQQQRQQQRRVRAYSETLHGFGGGGPMLFGGYNRVGYVIAQGDLNPSFDPITDQSYHGIGGHATSLFPTSLEFN